MKAGSDSRREGSFFDFAVRNYPVPYIVANYGLDEQRAKRVHAYLRSGMKDRKAAMLEAGYSQSFAESGFRFEKLPPESKVISDFFAELQEDDEKERAHNRLLARKALRRELDEDWRDGIKMQAIRMSLNESFEISRPKVEENNANTMDAEEMERLLKLSGVLPSDV